MRLTVTTLLLALSLFIYPQEENSLLWQISGNGLQGTSYLYGTMHVSKKIAFRLDDVFYEALKNSEIVALESDPETWLSKDERIGLLGYNQVKAVSPKGFYIRPFLFNQPEKSDLANYLSNEERVLNNIMYRTDKNSRNFEEDTYLDMFIYQAGRKFGKSVVALEDLEQSSVLVGRASLNAMKRKPDEWLQKKMQDQSLMYLMQDAYRERNINLLDSIDRAVYTPYYLENMLYIRNENMTRKLDSIMKLGKVFAGIGAAHLPGDRGVISMLRAMGYKVVPLTSAVTHRGKIIKEKIQNTFAEPRYSKQFPEDQSFSLMLPSPLFPVIEEDATTYVSTDLTNGSYVIINRVPTYSFLKEKQFNLEEIDQLLFENIPGTILEKSRIENSGFPGIDIKNRLKNGDHQRYQIFLTPLEIIMIKMGGEGRFVLDRGPEIFKSLSFKPSEQHRITLTSKFRDFKVAFPSYHRFTNKNRKGLRSIEGYCRSKNSYYFLRKATLNDLRTIEEDSFELRQIQKRFYQDLELDPEYGKVERQRLRSRALFPNTENRYLYLQTAIKGGEYYLMGILTGDVAEAEAFFNSFTLLPAIYAKPLEAIVDTAMYFSTKSTVKPLKFVESSNAYLKAKDLKDYAPFTKKSAYVNDNEERIDITISKAHAFRSYPTIDSLWESRKKFYAGNSFSIRRESAVISENGDHELELVLTDTASSRGIKVKNIVRGGLIYELKTITDSLYAESRFTAAFFDNFKPMDTVIGKAILGDRSADLFSAMKHNDSILDQGYSFVNFGPEDLDSLQYYIANNRFLSDRPGLQNHLITQLGKLDAKNSDRFLRQLYESSYHNSGIQTTILQVVANQKNAQSAGKLLALLEIDIPLLGNDEELNSVFQPFRDSLPLAKDLFPGLLRYSSIPEYKAHIIDLLASLKSGGLVKPAHYKKYKDQFLNDAKQYLKRQLSHQSNPDKRGRYYGSVVRKDRSLLKDYLTLLLPFAKEEGVMDFFHKVWLVEEPVLRTAYVGLLAQEDYPIPNDVIQPLATDLNSRASLYIMLSKMQKANLIPPGFRSQQAIAASLIYDEKRYSPEKDSIVFLKSENIVYRNQNYTAFYFKTKNSQDFRDNFKLQFLVFKTIEENKIQTRAYYRNKGVRIEDTDTEEAVMERVKESFLIKDRPRAVVFGQHNRSNFGAFNF